MRGSLLPDDERLLAEQWLLVERSVFEVEHVHPGHGVTVRDVRTGDTHELRERAASRHLKPGLLVCARVVPAGDTMQFFGGLEPVGLHERDRADRPARHRARRGGTGGVPEPPIRTAHADQYRGRSARASARPPRAWGTGPGWRPPSTTPTTGSTVTSRRAGSNTSTTQGMPTYPRRPGPRRRHAADGSQQRKADGPRAGHAVATRPRR